MENKPTIREAYFEKFPTLLVPLEGADTKYMYLFEQVKFEVYDFFLNKIKEVVGSEELCTCSDLPQIPHRHQSNEKINQERQRILKEFGIIK